MTATFDKQHKRALSVNDFCDRFEVGRTKAYAEMAEGRLKSVTIGRKRLIPSEYADEWFEGIKAQSRKTAA